MCIVIDTNTLSMVFSENNVQHDEFKYVKEWILDGKGTLVYGGTRYKNELIKAGRFLKLIRLLRDSGKAIKICTKAVDDLEKQIAKKTVNTDCDDQHIIALLGASKCPLLCSCDVRSYIFIKNRDLYPKKCPVVKIYSGKRNQRLLKSYDSTKLNNIEF